VNGPIALPARPEPVITVAGTEMVTTQEAPREGIELRKVAGFSHRAAAGESSPRRTVGPGGGETRRSTSA